MDCLMPEMDGYTATSELRRREAASGGRRTPVIALTASARPVDRQRCLDSGMDDFLSKPIRGASLEAVLDRWTADRHEVTADRHETPETATATANGHASMPESGHDDAPRATDGATPAVPDPVIHLDKDALQPIWELEELGRPGLFDEMLDLFRQEGAMRLRELRAAVGRQDAHVVYRLAHTMKGEALAWGATDLVQTSRQLEERSSDGSIAELELLVMELDRLFQATITVLDTLRPTPA
jgi:HPt (histidine-containing phosphotransfer) domain-containing protein